MPNSIYHKLRERLDHFSVGFPISESGIELKILKKLYSEEDAGLFLDLTLLLEKPESLAARTGRDPTETEDQLEKMAKKGLIFRYRRGKKVKYGASPFVVGSFEFQLGSLDRELAEMVETYFKEGFLSTAPPDTVMPLRTVPVHQAVDVSLQIAPYQDAREIIKKKRKIVLAECICRKQQNLLEKGCGKPLEVCFVFGSHADFYLENGLGRLVSQEEALAVLDISEEAGLVNQPASTVNPGGMCNCCGDCCALLRAMNLQQKPAAMVLNDYQVAIEGELCTGCETCLDRCQITAITLDESETACVNRDRCIGCGLCVTTCPSEAISLVLKPEDEHRQPFGTNKELMLQTAERRGVSLLG